MLNFGANVLDADTLDFVAAVTVEADDPMSAWMDLTGTFGDGYMLDRFQEVDEERLERIKFKHGPGVPVGNHGVLVRLADWLI